jgi:hypothetical protein
MRFLISNSDAKEIGETDTGLPANGEEKKVDPDIEIVPKWMIQNLVANVKSYSDRAVQFLFHSIKINDTNLLDRCHTETYLKFLASQSSCTDCSDFVALKSHMSYFTGSSRMDLSDRSVYNDVFGWTEARIHRPHFCELTFQSNSSSEGFNVSIGWASGRSVFQKLYDDIKVLVKRLDVVLDRYRVLERLWYEPPNQNQLFDWEDVEDVDNDFLFRKDGIYVFSFQKYLMEWKPDTFFPEHEKDNESHPSFSHKLCGTATRLHIAIFELVRMHTINF